MVILVIEAGATGAEEVIALFQDYHLGCTQRGQTVRATLEHAPNALVGSLSDLVEEGRIKSVYITR